MSEYVVIESTICGRAIPPDGRQIIVEHVKYDRRHVVLGQDFEFVVRVLDATGQTVAAAGFGDEASAWRHVTGEGEQGHEIPGNAGVVVRAGLGIPDPYIVGRVPSLSSAPQEEEGPQPPEFI